MAQQGAEGWGPALGRAREMVGGHQGEPQLSGGMRWEQPLMMLLPRDEPRVMAIARYSQCLAARGGLQVPLVMRLKGEAVQEILK